MYASTSNDRCFASTGVTVVVTTANGDADVAQFTRFGSPAMSTLVGPWRAPFPDEEEEEAAAAAAAAAAAEEEEEQEDCVGGERTTGASTTRNGGLVGLNHGGYRAPGGIDATDDSVALHSPPRRHWVDRHGRGGGAGMCGLGGRLFLP